MTTSACLLLFPHVWQNLAISLFALGSVWLLARLLGFRDAKDRVWLFSLPFVIPWILPARFGGLVHLGETGLNRLRLGWFDQRSLL